MLHFVSGINSWLLSVNHVLITPVLTRLVLRVIGFFASSHYFWGDGELVLNFAKNLTVSSFDKLSQPNSTTYENGKIFLQKRDNHGTF